MNEVDFTKGFNNGYILAKHTPGVMQKLTASLQPDSDYLQGILSGAKQHDIEMQKTSPVKDVSKTLDTDKNKDRSIDIERNDR